MSIPLPVSETNDFSSNPVPEPSTDAGLEWVWRPGFGWVSRPISPALLALIASPEGDA